MFSDEQLSKLPKVNCDLVGVNGNAFAIMCKWVEQARRTKWPEEAVDTVIDKCVQGDYQTLIKIIMSYSKNVDGTKDFEDDFEDDLNYYNSKEWPEDDEEEGDPWEDKDKGTPLGNPEDKVALR